MQIILKIILVLILSTISYQDFKERKIYIWGVIVSAILLGFLHYRIVGLQSFCINIVLNSFIVVFVLLILFLYAKYKIKIPLSQGLGYGDMFFFFIMGLGFPSLTFLVVFVFSLLFALIIYIVFLRHVSNNLIPLAGFQALFLIIIFLFNWSYHFTNLYLY